MSNSPGFEWLVFVKYLDHVLYNRASSLAMQPQVRQAGDGWFMTAIFTLRLHGIRMLTHLHCMEATQKLLGWFCSNQTFWNYRRFQ